MGERFAHTLAVQHTLLANGERHHQVATYPPHVSERFVDSNTRTGVRIGMRALGEPRRRAGNGLRTTSPNPRTRGKRHYKLKSSQTSPNGSIKTSLLIEVEQILELEVDERPITERQQADHQRPNTIVG